MESRMNKQINEFLAEGMKRYKQATSVMISFQNETEHRLQNILSSRSADEWGCFVPGEMVNGKKRRNWSEYPAFHAGINGYINDTTVCVWIGINWYESENNYPFYYAKLETTNDYQNAIREFVWQQGIYQCEGWQNIPEIRFDPNQNDFNLERDFTQLLNELTRFFNLQVKQNNAGDHNG